MSKKYVKAQQAYNKRLKRKFAIRKKLVKSFIENFTGQKQKRQSHRAPLGDKRYKTFRHIAYNWELKLGR